jgi:hypothetical protein
MMLRALVLLAMVTSSWGSLAEAEAVLNRAISLAQQGQLHQVIMDDLGFLVWRMATINLTTIFISFPRSKHTL